MIAQFPETLALGDLARRFREAEQTVADAEGMIVNMNLIVGTTHNNAPINLSVTQAAKSLIHDGKYDQGVLNTVEMAIRAYDPCLSCATHRLDGKMSVKLDIFDAKGALLDSLAN